MYIHQGNYGLKDRRTMRLDMIRARRLCMIIISSKYVACVRAHTQHHSVSFKANI